MTTMAREPLSGRLPENEVRQLAATFRIVCDDASKERIVAKLGDHPMNHAVFVHELMDRKQTHGGYFYSQYWDVASKKF